MIYSKKNYEDFLTQYKKVSTPEAVFYMVRDNLSEHFKNEKLTGLSMNLRYKDDSSFNGSMSFGRYQRWPSGKDEIDHGFTGNISFRLESPIRPDADSMSNVFSPMMIHCGEGGAGSKYTPWKDSLGTSEIMNVYRYSIHFMCKDFPGIMNREVLNKLADKKWDNEYKFYWEPDGQAEYE